MNLIFRYSLMIFIILISTSIQLFSQVTIGSGISPVDGSLLDLKELGVTNGANSTKGVLFPRVSLTQKNSLIDISDVDFANIDEQQAHTGLTVYNVNPSFDEGAGLHFWDGTTWLNMRPDTITQIQRDTITRIIKDTVTLNIDKTYFVGMANDASSLLNIGIADSVWKTLVFQTIPIDSKASYDRTTGIFKINSTGTFNIYARYIYSQVGIATTIGVVVYKKAVGQSTFSLLYKDERTALIALTGGVMLINQPNVVLNAGDELIFGLQTGGINLSIANGGDSASATIKQN